MAAERVPLEERYDARSVVLVSGSPNIVGLFLGHYQPDSEGVLLVLDGVRGHVYSNAAIAGTLIPDGSGFIYGAIHSTYNDQDDSDPSNDEDDRDRVAKRLGVDKAVITANEWHDGICCSYVSQLVHVDLATKKKIFLKLVGGSSLCHDGKHVLGLLKKDGSDMPHWLDLANQRWIPVEKSYQVKAKDHLSRCGATTEPDQDLPAGTLMTLPNSSFRIELVERSGAKVIRVGAGTRGRNNAAILPPTSLPRSHPDRNAGAQGPSSMIAIRDRILDEATKPATAASLAKSEIRRHPSALRMLARAANTRGYRLDLIGKLDEALLLFEAAAADASYGMPRYNAARVYARKGEVDRCLARLEEIKRLGPGQRARLRAARTDPGFTRVLTDARFKSLVE